MKFYSIKENEYYTQTRRDILPYIPKTGSVLDVGCSGGNTLCYLKENKIIDEGVGIDFMEIVDSNQKNPLIDKFILANIEKKDLDLPENHFDVLLCADVLEHLTDPWDTLEYLKTFCKNGAYIIISIPNIREYRALYKVFFKGDFQYQSSGILDKTHLRFFCKKNISDLVINSDLNILSIQPSFKTCPLQKKRKTFSAITFGIFDQFLAQQYIVVAKKNS